MFAFSQIIAHGDQVSKVTKLLEDQNKQEQPKQDDEDEAILAFSNTLPGNDGAPVVVTQSKEEIEKQRAAEQELQQLQTSDATAAFANLVND